MKVQLCLVMLVAGGIGLDAAAQPIWHNLAEGEYPVGFRLFEERDGTRVSGGANAGPDRERRVRAYVWYPAESTADEPPMRLGRYFSLARDDGWPFATAEPVREKLRFSRHALARSVAPGGLEALARQPVRARAKAEPLAGPFPLIVIGQGLYYESPIAFVGLSEYLAGRGFVVATCPLVGTRSPLVKLDVQDLETEVRDLEVVLARARKLPYVSADRLGVMGFDMGGMAGLILAMRNRDVDAFVSAESGILYPHPSGLPAASSDYDARALRIPWLHVGRRSEPRDGQGAADSLFETAVHSDRYHLRIEGLEHVDATSYALIEGRDALLGYWPAWDRGSLERHEILARYVLEFFSAYLENDPESLAFLKRDPAAPTAEQALSMDYRSATPPSITYEQFVEAILAGDAAMARAIEQVRALRTSEPSHRLLEDFYLYRLGYSLLYSWDLREEAMEVNKLNVELNPSSPLATQGLSMSYVAAGNHAAAVEVYRRLLEKRPGDESVQRTLEWLEGQLESSKKKR